VRVEHCERVHVIVAAKRICIANCRECIFFLGVNQQPLMLGDNHKLQVSFLFAVALFMKLMLCHFVFVTFECNFKILEYCLGLIWEATIRSTKRLIFIYHMWLI